MRARLRKLAVRAAEDVDELAETREHDAQTGCDCRERWGFPGAWRGSRRRQDQRPVFRVKVDMVVLSFTVTDSKGRYVNGLKPGDFRILEDGIAQKFATFAEGNKPAVQVLDDGTTRPLIAAGARHASRGPDVRTDAFVGTNVFVLFDTSNYMYRGFVYASDAIADFVRGLDRADSVAVYTFSRNLSRAADADAATATRPSSGLRKAVAGDDSALYNALLLTLRDAAKVPGRKVVIVFSNGPDNASMVAPDDVRAVAEDEGIPIYVISTSEVQQGPHFDRRVPPHLHAHRRQGLLRQDLAEAGGGLRVHSRGPGQLLHGHLLSAAQPERGLPQDLGRDHHRRGQEVSRARAPRLPPARRVLSLDSPEGPAGFRGDTPVCSVEGGGLRRCVRPGSGAECPGGGLPGLRGGHAYVPWLSDGLRKISPECPRGLGFPGGFAGDTPVSVVERWVA